MCVSFQLHCLNVIPAQELPEGHLTSLGPRRVCVVLKVTCLRGESDHPAGLILITNQSKLRLGSLEEDTEDAF